MPLKVEACRVKRLTPVRAGIRSSGCRYLTKATFSARIFSKMGSSGFLLSSRRLATIDWETNVSTLEKPCLITSFLHLLLHPPRLRLPQTMCVLLGSLAWRGNNSSSGQKRRSDSNKRFETARSCQALPRMLLQKTPGRKELPEGHLCRLWVSIRRPRWHSVGGLYTARRPPSLAVQPLEAGVRRP